MKIEALNCPACGAALAARPKANVPFTCAACGNTLVLTDWTTDNHLVCPECETLNDAQSNFCTACRARLQAGCPFCYTPNPLEVENCETCGANLQRAWHRQNSWLADKHQQDEERRQALKAAEAKDRQDRLKRLIHQLNEPTAHPIALLGLGQLGVEAVGALAETVRSNPDVDARYGAAQALGMLGDEKAVPALTAALRDPEPAVRYWALNALGKLRSEAAVGAMAKLLKDSHKGVREQAEKALEHIGTPAAEAALRANKSWWSL